MKKITLEDLKKMKPGIFAHGITCDDRLIRAQAIKWVAVRGEVRDWSIYYHHFCKSNECVAKVGDKCCTEAIIKALVPCTDEAFGVYRF